jgi:hypothetical protein
MRQIKAQFPSSSEQQDENGIVPFLLDNSPEYREIGTEANS